MSDPYRWPLLRWHSYDRRPPRPSENWSARGWFVVRLAFVFSLWLAYFASAASLMVRWNRGPGAAVGFGALGALMIWSLTGFLSRQESVLYRKDGEADRDTSLVLRPPARQGRRIVDYVASMTATSTMS